MDLAFRMSVGIAALLAVSVYAEVPAHVAAEPDVFVGMVELAGDETHSIGVLLSTATEEVLIADNAIADQLMGLEGEVVAVEGRLIETADGPPTMVVRSFRVLGASRSSQPAGPGHESRNRLPMKVDEDVYMVSMKLPEFRKEDVRVELRDEFVAIRAARRKPENASSRSGRRPEAISRSFRLPADADREHLEASFDDGTLTLRIHRREARGPRSVELTLSSFRRPWRT